EPRQLPGVAIAQPVVVHLDLLAMLDPLLEAAAVVANAVTDRRQREGRQRVHEAGGEPAEPAVAQPRIAFGVEDLAEIEPALGGERFGGLVQAEVEQAQPEAAA